MKMISARNSSHGLESEARISLEGRSLADTTGLSLHELAVCICIDALVGGSHQPAPSHRFPEHLSRGNTLVLTLGGTPIWTSRNEAILPHELFGSAPQDISGGIYARHVTHQQCLYHLLATRLTWIGATELSLHSVSSSEASHDDVAFERLALFANELRAVAPSIAELSEPLRRHLTSDQPALLVTCDSGTIVMATPAFMHAWQQSASPVGMRFTDLMQNPVFGMGSSWSTRMIQLAGNTCPVTVVTFVSQAKSSDDETDPAAFLIHSLRNKLAGIVTAASFLSKYAASLSPDEREMMGIIESEADQFGRTLSQLNVLTVPSRHKEETTEIASALLASVDVVTEENCNWQITISDTASGRIGHSFRDITALCEAILLSHGQAESGDQSTVVEGSTHNGRLNVVFRTTGTPQAAGCTCQCWRAYADTIAERLGATITHESRNRGSVHLTHFESNILTQ
ncbi:MAG: hypothetical protein AAB305_01055 [Candidatus Zixiibacteriota bacterium]